jgi:hypothetical protein
MNWMEVLTYTSVAVWIFPAIRHFKNRFASYFLLYAVSDPLMLFFYYTFNQDIIFLKIPFYLVLLSTFLPKKIFNRNKIILFVVITLLSILGSQFSLVLEVKIIAHTIIFMILLRDFFKEYVNFAYLNMLVLVISLYELSALFKEFSQVLGIEKDYYYFHMTTLFQILFGVFFSLVGEWKMKMSSRNYLASQEENVSE